MGMDGSVVIELKLERSRFDRDLREVENLAPSLQVGLKLDSAKFKTDLDQLQKTRINLNVDTTAAQASIKALSKSEVKIGLKADVEGFQKQLKGLASSSETIFIPVEIDAANFAQQLKKLEQDTLPIKVDLAPNVSDFQEKLRRLSRISPINIEIKADKEAAFQQFEQIGKYAASGFAQGFSGTENAAKSAIDSLVSSVNKQLGIQSPSRVFREIGRYAIAGLTQGLDSVDESKLKGVVNKIENYFKTSKIKAKVSLDAEAKNVFSKPSAPAISNSKISLKFDSSGLIGEISKAVETGTRNASKQNIFATLFGGLFKVLGGIGSAVLGTLALPFKVIGGIAATALTGAGLKLGEELSSGVASGLKSAIKNALSNSIGSGTIVGEALGEGIAKALGTTIEALFPNILKNIAETSRQVLGEEKVFTAGAVTRSQSASKQQQGKEVATAQLQNEFAATVKRGDPARARQLKSEIDAVSPQLQADSKSFASEFTAEQQRLQKIAEKFRVTLTPERLIQRRVKEYEAQVKRFENAIVQFEKQGDKQKAAQVRVALGQLKAPDQDPSKISQQELRMTENLQVSKIRNRFISRELNQKFGGRGAEIQRRNAELAPKIQEYNEVTGRIGTTARALEVLNVDPTPKAQTQVKKVQNNQPQAYKDIFQEVLSLSGVKNVPAKSIPKLAVDSGLRPGVYGTYDSAKNQIGVSKEAYELIQKGKIDAKGIEALVHELRHAVQFNFGKADVTASNKAAIPLLTPTPLETRELGRRIESSVEVQSPELQPISRKLEADAYVFAARNSGQVQQKVQKNNAVQGLESSLGIGGSKADLQIKRAQVEAVKRLTGIGKLAQEYGIDVQQELQISADRFDAISQSIAPILDRASSLKPLTAEEVSQLQSDLEAALSGVIEQIQAEPERLKSIVAGKLQEAKSAATTVNAPATPEAAPGLKASDSQVSGQKPATKTTSGSKQQAFDRAFQALKLDKFVAPRQDLLKLNESYGLSKSESQALQTYISGPYNFVNAYLREGRQGLIKVLDELKQKASDYEMPIEDIHASYGGNFDIGIDDLEKYITDISHFVAETLDKIPDFKGVVFRGEGMAEEAESVQARIESMKSKGTTEAAAFTSSGIDAPFKGKAQYVTKSRKGKVIQSTDVTDGNASGETLHNPGTKFKVIGTQSASDSLQVPDVFDEEEIKKIHQVLSPENLKQVGAQVIVYLEEIDTAVTDKVEEIKDIPIEKLESPSAEKLNESSTQATEALNSIKPVKLPSAATNPKIDLKSSQDTRKFIKQNLNAQGTKDLARRMGIDTKNSNKEYLLNEISSLAGTAANRNQIAQLISQLSPDKFLAKSTNKNDSSALVDAGKIISELKKARKNLADALKIAQELDAKERQIILEQVIESSQEQEAIAKQLSSEYQLSAKDSKSLGGVKSQLGGITNQAKQSLAEVQSVENPAEIGTSLGENLVSAIGSGMNVAANKPIKVIQTVMQGIKGAAEKTAEIKSPSRVFQRIGKFITEGLVTGIESGKGAASNAIASVMDSMAKVKLPELHGQDKLDARLAQLEELNSIDPSIGADVAIADANKSKERRDETVGEIKRSPRKFIRQRAKSAVIQKARYITENAEQIAGIIGTKVGDNPTATQAKGLIDLQEKFGQLGEAAARFGEKKSNKNFQELDTAVKALEKSLSALGLPFTQINQEIDAYVAKLKTLQGEGKIDIEVDVESLAPEKFSFIDNLLSKFSGLEATGLRAVGGLVKSFLAFQGLNFVQGFFTNIAQGAFKAFVELDRLKTSLNFSSGSKALGAQNLKFADNTADSLGIPLKESREGFTSLNAAARKTTLEGQGTRDLFVGMAQASTTLSLSTEQNQRAFQALTQILSKGKVSAEEMRGQLAESGLAGAMSIAARAIGVTDQEFNRLLESGQILSQDFLPKFAKQLQAEFGDAAQEAAGNAQSAIYNTQNAFQTLQEGIGAGIAPAVIMGLNALAGVMKAIASVSTELGIILGVIIVTLSVKMTAALASVIQQLILTKAAGGSLGGAFASVAQTINNSFSAKLAVGLFAALEIINLLSQAVNTNLVKSFDDAARSAQRAAEESVKIKTPVGKESKGTEPESSSGVGRAIDNFLLNPINRANEFMGFDKNTNLTTYGQLEKNTVEKKVSDIGQGNTEFLSSANIRLQALKNRKGKIGELPGIDFELTQAEQSRQILQAQMKRNYTDKGLAVPAELKQKLESQNLGIQNLNTKRSDIAKPFSLDITRADQQISSIKAQIESLRSPEAIAAVGGNEAAAKLTEELKTALAKLKSFKADAESTLASLKVDPILAFTNALRKLNLAFAENQEQNQQKFEAKKSSILQTQVSGFSTNKFNSKQASIQLAEAEQRKALADYKNEEASAKQFNAEAAMPQFQNTLQRLGVTKDSSAAKIEDVLKNTQDEADKGILEKLKAGKEQKNKLSQSASAFSESQLKTKQATQDYSLTRLQDASATQNSAIQKAEAQKINAVKFAQQARLISESEAAEKIARISSNATVQQQRSAGLQLSVLRTLFSQGKISAEEFHTRQRELTDQQTSLEKQAADQRLAVFEATNRRKLEIIELANRKAEATIQLGQTTATTQIKEAQLSANISPEKAAQLQNQVEQKATSDKADLIRKQIAETKQLRSEGAIDAKTATEKELQLNQELAQSNQSLIDQQIQAQQQLRDEIEKTFQRRKAQLDLEKSEADVNLEFGNLNRLNEQVSSKSPRDLKGLELVNKSNSLKSDRANIEKQMALLNDQHDAIPRLKLSPQEADDKRRQNDIEFNQLRVSQIKNEQEQILTKQEIEINGIERAKAADDSRHRQVVANLDAQKAKLDLINQSLELTSKLNESRLNLSKALSDANIAPLEIKKTQADTALGLSRRLDDKELAPKVRSAIKEQLSSLGMGEKELDILEKRSQIEDEIAAKKLEALKTEQEYQRAALQLDLQRQRIAAEMAIYEAESAQLSASKSKIEAESALKTAQSKKDDIGVKAAEIGIELAAKEAALANKKLALSKKGLEAQDELASNAIRAQEATQRTAIDQQVAADGARKQASALEKVEASVKKITSKSDTPQADQSAQSPPPGWENPYIQKPGEDLFAYNLRINTAKMQGQIVETNVRKSVVDQSGFNYDEALNRRQGNPPASDFDLKSSNPTGKMPASAAFDTGTGGLKKLLTDTNELPESLRKLVANTSDKSLQLGDKTNPLDLKTPDIAAQVKTAIAQATPTPDTNMATIIIDGFKNAISGVEQRMDKLSASITALANTPRSLTVQSCSPVDDAASILRDIANNSAAAAAI